MVATFAIALALTVFTLVACAWTGPRRASGVGRAGRRSGRGGDPWHGDPRPDVAGRPAGADAEAMSPDPDPVPSPDQGSTLGDRDE